MEIYISTDVETDGPIPGPHSMLSFASAAFTGQKQLLQTFSANLQLLPDAAPDPKTMQWWATQPQAWHACRQNLQQPQDAMPAYVRWLKSLPGKPVFVAYPDGRVIGYVYGEANSLNDVISRLSSITNNGDTLESYLYLGMSTVVQRADPASTLSLIYQSGDTDAITSGDSYAGDRYTGLDRFGRVIDQNWLSNADTSTSTDRFQYTYDDDSNVTAKSSIVNDGTAGDYDESYTYDNLNRLTSYYRGGTLMQSYDLDALGNQAAVNSQNELDSASYDSNGNTTDDGSGHTFDYNAWNQMVDASNGTLTEDFTYDGFGRRVSTTQPDATTFYYSSQGQVLEEISSDNMYDYIWSPVYVDALITRIQVDYGVVSAYQGANDGGGAYTANLTMTVATMDSQGDILIAGQVDISAYDGEPRVFIMRIIMNMTDPGVDTTFGDNEDPINMGTECYPDYDTNDPGDMLVMAGSAGTLTGISVDPYGNISLSYTDFSSMAPDMSGYGSGITVVGTSEDDGGNVVQALQGPGTDVFLIRYSNGGGLHYDSTAGVVDTGLTSFNGLSVDPSSGEASVISGSTVYNYTNELASDGTAAAPTEPSGGIVSSGGVIIGTFVTPHGQTVCAGQYDGTVYVEGLVDNIAHTVYVQQDANWNVTAILNCSSTVLQRYLYDPHGNMTVLAADGTSTTDAYGLAYGYQGGRIDPVSGFILFNATGVGRDYDPMTGTWVERDKAGSIDGSDPYQAFGDNPIDRDDPTGLLQHIKNPDGTDGGLKWKVTDASQDVTHSDDLSRGREIWNGDKGLLYADNGTPIVAFKYKGDYYDKSQKVFVTQQVYGNVGNAQGTQRGYSPSIRIGLNLRPAYDVRDNGNAIKHGTDCHGETFTAGEFWIDDDQIPALLKGDGYVDITADVVSVNTYITTLMLSPQVIIVFQNKNGTVYHSVQYAGLDPNRTMNDVLPYLGMGKGGIEPTVTTQPLSALRKQYSGEPHLYKKMNNAIVYAQN